MASPKKKNAAKRKPPKKTSGESKASKKSPSKAAKAKEEAPELNVHVEENDLRIEYTVLVISGDGVIVKRQSSVLLEGIMLETATRKTKISDAVKGVVDQYIRDSIINELEIKIIGGPQLHGRPTYELDEVQAETVEAEVEIAEEPSLNPEPDTG